MIKKHVLFAFGILAAVTAACGGGGGGGSLAPISNAPNTVVTTPPASGGSSGGATNPPVQTQSVGLTVFIPAATTTSSTGRKAQYISPNSKSFTMTLLTVNGTAQSGASAQGPFNLVAGTNNPNCKTVSGGTQCSFSIGAPVGSDIFLANTFSGTDGVTGPLGSGAVILSVTQNATNSAALALTGPVASVQVVSATTTLYNGNPGANFSSSYSIARVSDAASVRANMAATTVQSTVRGAQATATSAPAPTPPPGTGTASRLFVIALDVNGNQIINPTTFDIPITLKLNLNGAPAGSVTLGVTYAGLTGEPSSAQSTTSDAGTVTIFAPSDVVSLTTSSSTTSNSTYAPSVVGIYTPQGGTQQTTTPLTYALYIPPAAPYIAVSISNTDPWSVSQTQPVTVTFTNTGSAATTGSSSVYIETSYSNVIAASASGWTCSGSSYQACSSTMSLAAGASVTFNATVVVGTTTTEYLSGYFYNTSIANSSHQAQATSRIAVATTSAPTLYTSVTAPPVLYVDTPFSFTVNTGNSGTSATSGTVTALNTIASSSLYGYNSATGSGWSCSPGTGTVSCTTSAVAGPSSTFPPVMINLTPNASALGSAITDSVQVSGGGAANTGSASSGGNIVRSPLYFASSAGSIAPNDSTGIGFVSGSSAAAPDASLNLGFIPTPGPSPTPPASLSGTVRLYEQATVTGNLSIMMDTCTGSVIDGNFAGAFSPTPLAAPAPGGYTDIPIGVYGQSNNTSCYITVGDAASHQATLNINLGSTNITVQGKRRTTGVTR